MNIFSGSNTPLGSIVFRKRQNHNNIALADEHDYYYHPQKLDSLFTQYNPRYFFNFFEYSDIAAAEYWREHTYTINAQALKYISELCQRHNTHLIHISSLYIFSRSKGPRYTVEDAPEPVNVYGDAKFLAEQYIQQSGCTHTIIRIPDLFDQAVDFNMPYIKSEKGYITTVEKYKVSPMSYSACASLLSEILTEPAEGIMQVSSKDDVEIKEFLRYFLDERENPLKDIEIKAVSPKKFASIAPLPAHASLESTIDSEPWKKFFTAPSE